MMEPIATAERPRVQRTGLLPALVRALAGLGGGYLLASTVAIVLAKTLPMARVDAVLTGAMASFVVYVCAMLWAFIASSALRACFGIGAPMLGLAALNWIMG